MKKNSIFAAFNAKEQIYLYKCIMAIFVAIDCVFSAKITGCRSSVSYGTCTVICSLARMGKGSLSSFIYLIFHSQMPKNNENASNANNSSIQARPCGTKSASELFHPEFVEFTEQLREMRKWFESYLDNTNKNDKHIIMHFMKIEDALINASIHIADLVAIEFQENVFYKR